MSAPQNPFTIQGTNPPQYAPQAQYPYGQGYPAQPMYQPPAPPVVEEEPSECKIIFYSFIIGTIIGVTRLLFENMKK